MPQKVDEASVGSHFKERQRSSLKFYYEGTVYCPKNIEMEIKICLAHPSKDMLIGKLKRLEKSKKTHTDFDENHQ